MTALTDIAFDQCVKHCMETQMTSWGACADYCDGEQDETEPDYDDGP